MKKLLSFILLFWISNLSHGQSNNPLFQTPNEDDWTLPGYVQKNDNAGLYYAYTVPDAYSLLLRWKDLNPAEDVYDWTAIDNAVALNVPFFIRIWASDTMHCPQWLGIKHPTIPIFHSDGGIGTSSYYDLFEISPSNFYAMWDTNFTVEFKKFLLAFKAKNYLANPNVKFMYCPGGFRYNEWNLGGELLDILTTSSITPGDFVNWFHQHLTDYADASNGYVHKMMFTGYGRIENPSDYAPYSDWFFALNDTIVGDNLLTSYAVSIGMSVREGAQEAFNSSSDHFAWGAPSTVIDNIRYQTIDDNHPLLTDSLRIIGTENEAFCDPNMLMGGVCSYYHIKMATLKAMQLRVNWLNVTDSLITYDPDLFQYFRLTAKKSVKESPDAWAVLRQVYDPFFSTIPPSPVLNSPLWTHRVTLPARNWEKWLTQREVLPDGKVVPVYQLASSTSFDYYNFEAQEALRTDKINGSDYMYFNVDSNFIYGGASDVQIKITYLDNFNGNWWLEYDAAGSQIYKQSQQITNANTNTWKTITLNIPDAGFTNRQTGGMDFRIYNGGNQDISVRFVRVIKNNNPLLGEIENPKVEFNLTVFPNPANTILNITSEKTVDKIVIFNSLGQTIKEFIKNESFIDVSTLDSGVYFVTFFINSDRYTRKVILAK